MTRPIVGSGPHIRRDRSPQEGSQARGAGTVAVVHSPHGRVSTQLLRLTLGVLARVRKLAVSLVEPGLKTEAKNTLKQEMRAELEAVHGAQKAALKELVGGGKETVEVHVTVEEAQAKVDELEKDKKRWQKEVNRLSGHLDGAKAELAGHQKQRDDFQKDMDATLRSPELRREQKTLAEKKETLRKLKVAHSNIGKRLEENARKTQDVLSSKGQSKELSAADKKQLLESLTAARAVLMKDGKECLELIDGVQKEVDGVQEKIDIITAQVPLYEMAIRSLNEKIEPLTKKVDEYENAVWRAKKDVSRCDYYLERAQAGHDEKRASDGKWAAGAAALERSVAAEKATLDKFAHALPLKERAAVLAEMQAAFDADLSALAAELRSRGELSDKDLAQLGLTVDDAVGSMDEGDGVRQMAFRSARKALKGARANLQERDAVHERERLARAEQKSDLVAVLTRVERFIRAQL